MTGRIEIETRNTKFVSYEMQSLIYMLIEIGCIAIFLIEIKDPCCSLIFSEQRFDDVRYDNFYVGIIISPISSFSSIHVLDGLSWFCRTDWGSRAAD